MIKLINLALVFLLNDWTLLLSNSCFFFYWYTHQSPEFYYGSGIKANDIGGIVNGIAAIILIISIYGKASSKEEKIQEENT